MPGLLSQPTIEGLIPYQESLLGPATVNPLMQRKVQAQRAANPRPDVTDLFGYGPDWSSYIQNMNRNLNAQLPQMDDPPEVMAKKGVAMYGNFAPFGITAFHGSPHKFDKFDMKKIGTGEGAQVYGHGLYFAENPGVAKSYQHGLSQTQLRVDGKQWVPQTAAEKEALNYIQNAYDMGSQNPFAHAKQTYRQVERPSPGSAKAMEFDSAIESLQSAKPEFSKGAFYKVDLPDDQVAKMLDWDKPLSQQPESVRAALKPILESASKSFPALKSGDPTGAGLYQAYMQHRGGNASAASEAFRGVGVPGVRYLDGGSRGAGQGTSNFVVFDDQIPKIIGRE